LLPKELGALSQRLRRTQDRSEISKIAQEAVTLAKEERSGGGRACAHYLAAGAYFFLSSQGEGQWMRSAQAVHHLIQAEMLAPEQMKGAQPKSRLRTAWGRLGKIEGWLDEKKAPVRVILPALRLRIQPAEQSWRLRCNSAPCHQAVQHLIQGPAVLSFRPGRYRVDRLDECGSSTHVIDLKEGALLFPKAPPCLVHLEVHGKEGLLQEFQIFSTTGQILNPEVLHGGMKQLKVKSPGYHDASVSLPEKGGSLVVKLKPCSVRLRLKVEPSDARLEGAGEGPWGARRVRAFRPGYAPLKKILEIPPSCGASKEQLLVMERQVRVEAKNPDGDPVIPSRLGLADLSVSPIAFSQPPGSFVFRAEHPDYKDVIGHLHVEPCSPGPCGAQRMRFQFQANRRHSIPKRGGGRGPFITMGLGGLMITGGLLAGAAAMGTQSDINTYTNKREEEIPLDDLISRRGYQTQAADYLIGAGGLSLASGLLWYFIQEAD